MHVQKPAQVSSLGREHFRLAASASRGSPLQIMHKILRPPSKGT